MKRIKKETETEIINKLMKNLDDDGLLPDKIKLADIKIFNKKAKLTAVTNLIERCEEFEQGLVERCEFIRCRNIPQCPKCASVCGSGEKLDYPLKDKNGNTILVCKTCYQKQEQARANAILAGKWQDLCDRLRKFDKSYTLVTNERVHDTKIVRETDCGGEKVKFSIQRESMYSGGSFYHSRCVGHALRIYSDRFRLKADRLKRDFDTTGVVAKALHKRIETMVSEQIARNDRTLKAEKRENEISSTIIKELGVSKDNIHDCYFGSRYRHKSTRTKQVYFGNAELIASNNRESKSKGKIVYSVKRFGKSFTAAQLKKLVAFAEKL